MLQNVPQRVLPMIMFVDLKIKGVKGISKEIFTVIPSYFKIEILPMHYQTATLGTNGLKKPSFSYRQ